MAGPARQRTFDLVPETLVPKNIPRKPMTLKQAKKAAAITTKGPKLSRAERARLEKEELDRQRKERDRLRASEKARLAREKKASKLAEEKASRKKMGIPEPSKFVRPSQPTISGFVTAGFKRRRTESLESKSLEQTGGEESPESGSKLTSQLSQTSVSSNSTPQPRSSTIEEKPQVAEENGSKSPITTKAKDSLQVMLNDCEEFDEYAEVFATLAESDVVPGADARGRSTVTSNSIDLPQNPTQQFGFQKMSIPEDRLGSKNLHNNNKIMLPPPLPGKQTTKTLELVPEKEPRSNTLNKGAILAKTSLASHLSTSHKRQPLANRPINMPPPPLPPKRPSYSSALFTPVTKRQVFPASLPSSSTQAFLSDNLDQFFPSPSQEIRELRVEERAKCLGGQSHQFHDRQDFSIRPSFGAKAKGLSTEHPLLDNLVDFFPSPSQEMRDLRKEDEIAQQVKIPSPRISARNPDTHIGNHIAHKSDAATTEKLLITDKVLSNRSDDTKNKPKIRFFCEKEEDIVNTALAGSLQSLKQGTAITSEKKQSAQKRKFSRILSQGSDYDDEDLDWNSQEAQQALEIGEGV